MYYLHLPTWLNYNICTHTARWQEGYHVQSSSSDDTGHSTNL